MQWRLAAFPWSAIGDAQEVREYETAKLSFKLNAPSTCSFSMDGQSRVAASIQELVTDMLVSIVGIGYISRMRCGSAQDTLGETNHGCSFGFLDYRGVLNRRKIRSTDTLSYSSTDQGSIVMGMINSVQARTNGNYGISAGSVSTGVSRTVQLAEGEFAGKRIETLSNMDNGFDWDIVPNATTGALVLNLWTPNRGSSVGQTLEYGRSVRAATRAKAVSSFANDILTTGGPTTTPVQSESPLIATDPAGRWDAVMNYSDVAEQATLNDRGAFNIDNASQLLPTYTVTLKRGFWEGPSHIWLGDTVGLNVRSGRINESLTNLRVLQIDVDLLSEGDEEVRMTLGYRSQ